jgi:hypothetical protein
MSILKPTIRWRKHIGEAEEAIAETEIILDDFQQRLSKSDKTQAALLLEVKHVILALNTLTNVSNTSKYPDLICTLEREELAEFIETGAQSAGLSIPKGVDITEKWREW